MDHLQTGGGNGRELDHVAVGQRGEDTEGLTVLVVARGQEARGEHLGGATGQTAQIGGEAGHQDRAGRVEHVQRVGVGGHPDVGGDVAVAGVVHQRHHVTGHHVHEGRVGRTVQHRELHQAGIAAGLLADRVHEDAEGRAAAVRVAFKAGRIEHAVGDRHVGFPTGEVKDEVDQCIGHAAAVARGDTDVDRLAGRRVDEGRRRAEGEIIQKDAAVQVDVHHGRGGIGGIVDHLQTGGRGNVGGVGRRKTVVGEGIGQILAGLVGAGHAVAAGSGLRAFTEVDAVHREAEVVAGRGDLVGDRGIVQIHRGIRVGVGSVDAHPALVHRLVVGGGRTAVVEQVVDVLHQIGGAIPVVEDDHLVTVGETTLPIDTAGEGFQHVGNVGIRVIQFIGGRHAIFGGEIGPVHGDGLILARGDARAGREAGVEVAETATAARAFDDLIVVRAAALESGVGQVVVAEIDRGRTGIVDLDELTAGGRHHDFREQQLVRRGGGALQGNMVEPYVVRVGAQGAAVDDIVVDRHEDLGSGKRGEVEGVAVPGTGGAVYLEVGDLGEAARKAVGGGDQHLQRVLVLPVDGAGVEAQLVTGLDHRQAGRDQPLIDQTGAVGVAEVAEEEALAGLGLDRVAGRKRDQLLKRPGAAAAVVIDDLPSGGNRCGIERFFILDDGVRRRGIGRHVRHDIARDEGRADLLLSRQGRRDKQHGCQ